MTTVLVADDDLDIRELVAFKLAQAGYEVRSAPDGVAALDAARAGGVDLVVLDLMMPGLSGLDVCAELPVIMLTARAQDQDVATGFAAGADDYVVKPFSPRELVSRVQAVLGRARA